MSDRVLTVTCKGCGLLTGAALVSEPSASSKFVADMVRDALKRGDKIDTVDGPVRIGGCQCKKLKSVKDQPLFAAEVA